jgi:hypothetical protein
MGGQKARQTKARQTILIFCRPIEKGALSAYSARAAPFRNGQNTTKPHNDRPSRCNPRVVALGPDRRAGEIKQTPLETTRKAALC